MSLLTDKKIKKISGLKLGSLNVSTTITGLKIDIDNTNDARKTVINN